MGLFDDDDDFADSQQPEPQPERARGSRMAKKHGVSHGDLFREEFGGLTSWTGKQVAVVALLVVVAAVLFVMHFGTDAGTIKDRVNARLGLDAKPLPGRVADVRAQSFELTFRDGSNTESGPARLAGVTVCSTKELRQAIGGAKVEVRFSPELGRQVNDMYVVSLSRSGKDIATRLLRSGAATVDTAEARKAKLLKRLDAASSDAAGC